MSRKDRTDVEEVREKSREVSGGGKKTKQRRKELPDEGTEAPVGQEGRLIGAVMLRCPMCTPY